MEKEKIRFRDLSGWLKTAIVFAWIIGGINTLAFIVGFIAGISGA